MALIAGEVPAVSAKSHERGYEVTMIKDATAIFNANSFSEGSARNEHQQTASC
jgi:hypothetical protein